MIDAQHPPIAALTRQAHFANDRMAGSVPVWNSNKPSPSVTATSLSLPISNTEQSSQFNHPPTMSFDEILDIVNPLHHLPVIGSLYRNISGDGISSVAKIAGGTLYTGPLGGIASLVSAAIEEHSGQNAATAIRSAMNDDANLFNKDQFIEERTASLNHEPKDKKSGDSAATHTAHTPLPSRQKWHFNS